MNTFYHVVPWFNMEELQKVYEEISDPTSNKEYALKTLLVWKARCPSLPSGIESTLTLLHVHVEDIKNAQDTAADSQLLRLAYSSALMRFVNHMLDTETVKGSSLYTAAKTLGVPDWIIDLRHDTAHSNNLPNITLLREACTISLLWLQKNYWDKYVVNIEQFKIGHTMSSYINDNKITMLIDLCTALSMCAHPNCKVKNLSEIPDKGMRKSIVTDVHHLFEDQVDLSNLKTVSISSLINLINEQGPNLLNLPDVTTQVNEAILEKDALFLSRDLLYFFSATNFKYKNKLNNSYMQCFEVLLRFLHMNDLILEFIMALIKITQDSETHPFKARLAAMWVSEILIALKRSQEFSSRIKQINQESRHLKKRKDLKLLYHHWFPNTKGKNILLDLRKPVPQQLLDINYVQPIIASYNPYLIYFIRDLLNLVEPSIPTEIGDRVYRLAELISTPEKFLCKPSITIYTVDDIKLANDNISCDKAEIVNEKLDSVIEDIHVKDHMNINTIWTLACKNQNWCSCPIGQLPWQQKEPVVAMES